MNEARQAAERAAEKICETWQVGTASRFCDDAPDWDSAETADVAVAIEARFAPLLAAKDAERDRLAKQVERLTKAAQNLVDKWNRHMDPTVDHIESGDFDFAADPEIHALDAALKENLP